MRLDSIESDLRLTQAFGTAQTSAAVNSVVIAPCVSALSSITDANIVTIEPANTAAVALLNLLIICRYASTSYRKRLVCLVLKLRVVYRAQ